MTLTDEQRDVILQDFLDIFQAKYGENWRSKLTTNLRPSPIHQIAEQRGVKVSDVKKVRSQLLAVGQLFLLFSTMTQPLETTHQPFELQF
jgi:hypothetical protein